MDEGTLCFANFVLDEAAGQLRRGNETIRLGRTEWLLLRYLVHHAGRLVSKEEIRGALWPDSEMDDLAIANCVTDLRRALGDRTAAARFVEVQRGRGYRFVARVERKRTRRPGDATEAAAETGTPETETPPPVLVGREAELERLAQAYAHARSGRRQLVFVAGEAGVGKTALVEAFAARVREEHELTAIARGHCFERRLPGEPYQPILGALDFLCTGTEGAHVRGCLRRVAPTWALHIPALLATADSRTVERLQSLASKEAMLRELAALFEALAAERPLVLVFEDLQWCDPPTVELLGLTARSSVTAKLLILATLRPADNQTVREIRDDLVMRGHATNLALTPLGPAGVECYLTTRFPPGFDASFTTLVHRRTRGNPLFLAAATDCMVDRGWLARADGDWRLAVDPMTVNLGFPESLKRAIELQIETLEPDDVKILEAASVVGSRFAVQAAAAMLDVTVAEAGESCRRLARRRRFLAECGLAEWPDGSAGTEYAFTHPLYARAFYTRIGTARLQALHQRAGVCLEQAWGDRVEEIAGTLVVHFENSRDHEASREEKLAWYRILAGRKALRRAAYSEAREQFEAAIQVLTADAAEHRERLLDAHTGLVAAREGDGSLQGAEAEETYARLLGLCEGVESYRVTFPALWRAWAFHLGRAEMDRALPLADKLADIADHRQDDELTLAAYLALATGYYFNGRLAEAMTAVNRALTARDTRAPWTDLFDYIPRAGALALAALTAWGLGQPGRARRLHDAGLAIARDHAHVASQLYLWNNAITLALFADDMDELRRAVDELWNLANERWSPTFLLASLIHRTWIEIMEGDAGRLPYFRQLLASVDGAGFPGMTTQVLVLEVRALLRHGRRAEALATIEEALRRVESTGVRVWEAELHRLRAEATLANRPPGASVAQSAEASYRRALAIAQHQACRWWALRAATGLSALRRREGDVTEASATLTEIVGSITGGRETRDRRAALAELEASEQAVEPAPEAEKGE